MVHSRYTRAWFSACERANDGVPAHLSLKWYEQENNQEWKQYYLRDDETVPSKCPFTNRG
jgi:FPC/CPF motif-containing protein YcgG